MANLRKRKTTKRIVVEWLDLYHGKMERTFTRMSDASRFANQLRSGKAKDPTWYHPYRNNYQAIAHYEINIIRVTEEVEKKV